MKPDLDITDTIDFDLWVQVKHWSGCWGGDVDRTQEGLENVYKPNWLRKFLEKSEESRTDSYSLSLGRGCFPESLDMQEYVIKAYFKGGWGFEVENNITPLVVTCADGLPAYSFSKYDSLRIGGGLFKGYQLKFKRNTITYTTIEGEGTPEHPMFTDNTVVASHLYMIENDKLTKSEISDFVPTKTVVINYKSSS